MTAIALNSPNLWISNSDQDLASIEPLRKKGHSEMSYQWLHFKGEETILQSELEKEVFCKYSWSYCIYAEKTWRVKRVTGLQRAWQVWTGQSWCPGWVLLRWEGKGNEMVVRCRPSNTLERKANASQQQTVTVYEKKLLSEMQGCWQQRAQGKHVLLKLFLWHLLNKLMFTKVLFLQF